MATTTRAFAVFRDEPESLVVDSKHDHAALTHSVPLPTGPLLVYAPDKENVNPLSGSRVLSEHILGKKRKTALVLKVQAASSPSKKLRPLAEKPTKKVALRSRTTDKKVKRTTSTKRTSSSRTRREPSLPRLAEEREEAEALDQAIIDAKCKELTVLPLADISEAYEQASSKDDLSVTVEKVADDKGVVGIVERAVTPPLPSSKEDAPSSPFVPAAIVGVFSTPERTRIYSAFTFSSPSPAAKRYADARGSSVEHFSDVVC